MNHISLRGILERVGSLTVDARRRDGISLSAPIGVQLVSVDADLVSTIARDVEFLHAVVAPKHQATATSHQDGTVTSSDVPAPEPATTVSPAPLSAPATLNGAIKGEIDPATGQVLLASVPAGKYRLVLNLPPSESDLRTYCTHGMEMERQPALDGENLFSVHYTVTIHAGSEARVELMLEPPYTHIQFVGYLIPTGERIGLTAPSHSRPTPVSTPTPSAQTSAQTSTLTTSTLTTSNQTETATVTPHPSKIADVLEQAEAVVATAVAGFQDDVAAREDLLQRCEIMKAAIRQAYETVHAARLEPTHANLCGSTTASTTVTDASATVTDAEDESVLKVFMAPEFYFQGSESGYPRRFAWELLHSLREEIDEEKYRNWLFVPGTFVAYRDKSGDNVNVFNFAPVMKGGPSLPLPMDTWAGLKTCTVIKTYVSGIDFQVEGTNTGNVVSISIGGETRQLNVENSIEIAAFVRGKTYTLSDWFSREGGEWCCGGKQGGSHFKIDNIVFGMEVCLDHAMRRLGNYQDKSAANGEPKAQVQLIPSAGMSILGYATVCDLICNVDQAHCVVESVANGFWPPVSALKVVAITDPGVKSFETFFETTTILNAPVGTDPSLLIQPGSAQYVADCSQLMAGYGYLVAYPPQSIPSPVVISR